MIAFWDLNSENKSKKEVSRNFKSELTNLTTLTLTFLGDSSIGCCIMSSELQSIPSEDDEAFLGEVTGLPLTIDCPFPPFFRPKKNGIWEADTMDGEDINWVFEGGMDRNEDEIVDLGFEDE